MLEIPETRTLARQIADTLTGRIVTGVFNATHPHKFTWYLGDPRAYPALLTGKRICGARGNGAFVDLDLDADTHLALSDGVNLRLYDAGAEIPGKYQLLLGLDDERFLVFTVAMYGGISAYRGIFDNIYHRGALEKPSPLEEGFDTAWFESLFAETKKNYSAKAFLATGQRIPGLGNGVLQDILFRAGIHPKRRLSTFGSREVDNLFVTIRETLAKMTAAGGRDTERDLFGNFGGYRTILSRNTCTDPCPVCGADIIKEAYMGGAVYYCPICQPLK